MFIEKRNESNQKERGDCVGIEQVDARTPAMETNYPTGFQLNQVR